MKHSQFWQINTFKFFIASTQTFQFQHTLAVTFYKKWCELEITNELVWSKIKNFILHMGEEIVK